MGHSKGSHWSFYEVHKTCKHSNVSHMELSNPHVNLTYFHALLVLRLSGKYRHSVRQTTCCILHHYLWACRDSAPSVAAASWASCTQLKWILLTFSVVLRAAVQHYISLWEAELLFFFFYLNCGSSMHLMVKGEVFPINCEQWQPLLFKLPIGRYKKYGNDHFYNTQYIFLFIQKYLYLYQFCIILASPSIHIPFFTQALYHSQWT